MQSTLGKAQGDLVGEPVERVGLRHLLNVTFNGNKGYRLDV